MHRISLRSGLVPAVALTVCVAGSAALAQHDTTYPSQLKGLGGWVADPVFTVGETLFAGTAQEYTPPGILDGIGALQVNAAKVLVLVNHELRNTVGSTYTLANGTALKGARVTAFEFDRHTRKILSAGLAYDTVYARDFSVVDDPADVRGGFSRFCSSSLHKKGTLNFQDDIYLTGEETTDGAQWALDVATKRLWAVPALGRGGWENSTPLNVSGNRIALLQADDTEGAPLYLWIGEKNASEAAVKAYYGLAAVPATLAADSFLNRNGLLVGQLYAFVPKDLAKNSPQTFNGTGNVLPGTWKAIPATVVLGSTGAALRDYATGTLGAFKISRPEDLSTNPSNRKEAVLASTGAGGDFPADDWGTIYVIKTNFVSMKAEIRITYDANDAGGGQFSDPDFGIRSPDNLDWADDGLVYVQEDRATVVNTFAGVSGEEASIWQLNPNSSQAVRIARVDRTVTLPDTQTNGSPSDIGNWETSGVLDVTKLFKTTAGERLLILDVQAHSVRDGSIASKGLVEGGQLLFLSKKP
jgi:secreted PhoX family phosphatase